MLEHAEDHQQGDGEDDDGHLTQLERPGNVRNVVQEYVGQRRVAGLQHTIIIINNIIIIIINNVIYALPLFITVMV